MTAAHCVDRFEFKFVNVSLIWFHSRLLFARRLTRDTIRQLTVELGMHKLSPSDAQVTKNVRRLTIHKEWNPDTNVSWNWTEWNRLKHKWHFPPLIRQTTLPSWHWPHQWLIQMPFRPSVCQSQVTNTPTKMRPSLDGAQQKKVILNRNFLNGKWIKLECLFVYLSGGSLPSVLKQSTVKVLANSKCKQSYPKIVNTMLCAAAPATDTCQVFLKNWFYLNPFDSIFLFILGR